jgi:putative heme-binding domain-containing protein
MQNGKSFSGVKIADNESSITLVDNKGDKHLLPKAQIEEQAASVISTMPEGLEKRMTEDEFVDLIAFLASLKEAPKP